MVVAMCSGDLFSQELLLKIQTKVLLYHSKYVTMSWFLIQLSMCTKNPLLWLFKLCSNNSHLQQCRQSQKWRKVNLRGGCWMWVGGRFVDRPNELRESKPPCPPPPPRLPLPPWLQSRHARQWAPMSSGL